MAEWPWAKMGTAQGCWLSAALGSRVGAGGPWGSVPALTRPDFPRPPASDTQGEEMAESKPPAAREEKDASEVRRNKEK